MQHIPTANPRALTYRGFVVTIEASDLVSISRDGERLGWASDLATAIEWVDAGRYIWSPKTKPAE